MSLLDGWPARHFDGVTPQPHAVRVHLELDSLVVVAPAGGVVRRWPVSAASIVNAGADPGETQLELAGEPIEALVVSGRDFLAALEAAGGGRKLRRQGGSSFTLRTVALLLLVAGALVFAAWRWGMPQLAAFAADRVPAAWERELGAVVIEQLAPPAQRVTEPAVVGHVEDAFAALLRALPEPRDSMRVHVIENKVVNAFAAPGGHVVVTTGLLRALGDSHELSAVLAHEIVHLTERHVLRGMIEREGLRAILGFLAGGDSGMSLLLGAAGTMAELSYSRSDETEADAGAAALLARAGIPPGAMVRALDRVANATPEHARGGLDFLSTHPAPAGRREHAERVAAETKVTGMPVAPDSGAWAELREALPGSE
jgi:predicted Zn-dependent protease